MLVARLNSLLRQNQKIRTISITGSNHFNRKPNHCSYSTKSIVSPVQRLDWNQTISDAEKIVDYPTPFTNLRWLLSDKVANVGVQLRKLVATTNPLQKTAKKAASQLVNITENDCNTSHNGRHNVQDFGLIVLLLSRAAGYASHFSDIEQDKKSGILYTQRALAEITEMIRVSHLVHQGMVNFQPMSQVGQNFALHHEIASSNKIVLLSGDYLLGCSCNELAGLRNQELNELLSAALRDMAESEFLGDRDEQNHPLPSQPPKTPRRSLTTEAVDEEYHRHLSDDVLNPIKKQEFMGSPESEWALRHTLSIGSLLGKGCQGALKLADLPDDIQRDGFWFGKSFALAWQACADLLPFQSSTLPDGATFSLVSAPVLYHLEYDPDAYEEIKKGHISVENIDYERLHREILKGPAVEKTHSLQQKQILAALSKLKKFPECDARTSLQNFLLAMRDY